MFSVWLLKMPLVKVTTVKLKIQFSLKILSVSMRFASRVVSRTAHLSWVPLLFMCVCFFSLATPGPPYALTIVEVTKGHVDLKWEPPKNDGGRPIQR